MAYTWIANITGKGYTPCEVSITGPSSSNSARAALRAQYPGAKVYNVRQDSNSIKEQWNDRLENSGAFNGGSSIESSNYNGGSVYVSTGISAAIFGAIGGAISNAWENTEPMTGEEFKKFIKWTGIIIASPFVLFFVYVTMPLIALVGGSALGYKYGAKFSQKRNIHVRFWLMLTLMLSAGIGSFYGTSQMYEKFNLANYGNMTEVSE